MGYRMISRIDLLNLFVKYGSCPLIHVHLEDMEYPQYKKSDVKDLLRDFKVKRYVEETADCDDRADDMRMYLRKNSVKAGYMKVPNHMMLIFLGKKNTLYCVDPGNKKIRVLPENIEYIVWW